MNGEQLYRHRPEAKGFEPIDSASFFGAIFYHAPQPKPDNPQLPRGVWYCHNEDCVVREVEVFCKLYGEQMPEMKCPACGERMKFHHWLVRKTLLPVKQGSLSGNSGFQGIE